MMRCFEYRALFIGYILIVMWTLFFTEIIKLAKGESDSQLSKITQCEQDTYEMQVRAANIGKHQPHISTTTIWQRNIVQSYLINLFFFFTFSASWRVTDETCLRYKAVFDIERFSFGERCHNSQFTALPFDTVRM